MVQFLLDGGAAALGFEHQLPDGVAIGPVIAGAIIGILPRLAIAYGMFGNPFYIRDTRAYGYGYKLSALIRNYRIAEIPISWTGRTWGSSNLRLKEMGRRYLSTLVIP